jgi:hypothetical protein
MKGLLYTYVALCHTIEKNRLLQLHGSSHPENFLPFAQVRARDNKLPRAN